MNSVIAFALWLWTAVTFLPRRLAAAWPWRKPRLYRGASVEEFPDRFEREKIYLAGEGNNLWGAAMVCPCGCGAVIELNLLTQVRPCWSVQQHPDETITLAPSVWRQKGCRSHFLIRRGRIIWC